MTANATRRPQVRPIRGEGHSQRIAATDHQRDALRRTKTADEIFERLASYLNRIPGPPGSSYS